MMADSLETNEIGIGDLKLRIRMSFVSNELKDGAK